MNLRWLSREHFQSSLLPKPSRFIWVRKIGILPFVPYIFLLLWPLLLPGQQLATQKWPAQWIGPPGATAQAYGVFLFRKTLQLTARPDTFRVHVSADPRFRLYVNGQLAGMGPASGHPLHWRYETLDLAPYLQKGENVLAAVVWQGGPEQPLALLSLRPAWLLQGATPREALANTDTSWRVQPGLAWSPTRVNLQTYYVAGPGECFQAVNHPWGWEQPGYADRSWSRPQALQPGIPAGYWFPWYDAWNLEPSPLPAQTYALLPTPALRESRGLTAANYLSDSSLRIPANANVRLLLDQGELTTAYLRLRWSGGKGSAIRVAYAEALMDSFPLWKNDRNAVAGKTLYGTYDSIRPDGGQNRRWETLWWRTWRYVELRIKTGAEPLVLAPVQGWYTAYPFQQRARFDTGSDELSTMWRVGWRTAQLCAHDTYMDCPYYERLQYIGDTRIQALLTYYHTGDDRLPRNAIEQIRQSLGADGITRSRYPARQDQYIAPFSLWWIGMVHDFWRYRDDTTFVQAQLPAMRSVLSFFQTRLRADGSLGHLPHWSFTDWAPEWEAGVAPHTTDGQSTMLDFQFLLALQSAAGLEQALGHPALAADYRHTAEKMRLAARQRYFDAAKGYFADTPDRTTFSQHAQALAVLTGTVTGKEAKELMQKTLADRSLTACTLYFKYYLHRAAIEADLGDGYVDWLDDWRGQLALGLTTWAEGPEPSRSDCHAWSAHPNLEFLRTVLGIDSGSPGFGTVWIAPHPGTLTHLAGSVLHALGDILVQGDKKDGHWHFQVTLPAGLTGRFEMDGRAERLAEGRKEIIR